MGKGSGGKAEVVEYSMSIHVGVGHELDAITEIRVDEKVAWRGNVTTNTAIGINNPNLFGGQRKEGGLVGTVQVLMGRESQVLPAVAAARYRLAPNDCPAFRGVTTLMFHGSGAVSTGRLGEWDNALADLLNLPGFPPGQPAYSSSGFLWKMNTPLIAQKIEVTGVRAPKGLDPATAMVGPDANPIHIIYECLVNDEWGMGGAAALIDKAGFETEAARLKDEGFGISLWWMRQQTIESFVTEILDHIQATIFVNPNTGLLSVKLLRDDYDIATLRHITPDNATLSNFKRRSSGEIVNEMTVSFTNPITEKAESITAQDIASIESQDGQKVAGSRDYYGIRNRELAGKVLARDLRASTAPLISAEAKLDRSGWDVLPGEVMLLSWPRRNASAVVVRAGKVSYGKPKDSAIRVSLMQDVFSLSKPAITVMPSTGWEDPTVDPQPLTMRLFTVPAFFARNAEMQGEAVALGPNEALVGALADSETYDSFDYELVSESVAASGDTVITSKGGKSMTPLAYLSAPMAAAATSVIPFALFPIAEETPRVGGFVFIGYGDTNQEIALVTGRTTIGWTIARGALDTVPKTWAASTPLWLVNPGARIVDTQTIYAEGSTAVYRGLDRTARGLLAYDDAPSVTTTVTDRAHLPLRPANVKVNGAAFGPVPIGSSGEIVVEWATRNRLLEDSQALTWTDGPVAPEYRQETVIRFLDFSGAPIIEYAGLWTETSRTFPAADFAKYASVIVEVGARRDESDSLNNHRITISGLPGDIGAGDPDPGPDRTNPPSIIPAPAVGAYAITAGSAVIFGGDEQAIVVTGTPDNRLATHLLIRYRPAPGDDAAPWVNDGPFLLDHNTQTHMATRGLLAKTNYEVEVSYVVGEIGSRWRNIGQILTGGIDAQDLLDRLQSVEAVASAAQQGVADLEEVFGDTVSAAESALLAGEHANLAVLKAGDASAAAAASNVSAGIASTKADEAGNSATAANVAKVAAEAARDTASGQATASATSAASAAASDTAAGQKAAAAEGSATTAATKAGEASTFANQAASSASGAAGSAVSASQASGTAVTARDAAISARNDAQAAAATAVTQSSSASASAASAAISADIAAKVSSPNANLIPNGGFETGNLDNWGVPAGASLGNNSGFGGRFLYVPLINGAQYPYTPEAAANASQSAAFSARIDYLIRNPAAGSFFQVCVTFYSDAAATVQIGQTPWRNLVTTAGTPLNTWKEEGFTKPVGVAAMRILLSLNSSAAQGDILISRAKLEAGPTSTGYSSDASIVDLSANLAITAAVSADAQTRLSSVRFDVTGGAGGDPFQIWARADGSGSAAGIVATELSLSNVVGGAVVTALKLVGGRAVFAAPISIVQGGRRTTLGPGFGVGSNLHLWSGPDTVAYGAETYDNGILGISDTEGFFGGKVSNGPFDSGTPSATSIGLSSGWTTVATVASKYLYNTGSFLFRADWQAILSPKAPPSEAPVYGLNWRVVSTNMSGGDLRIVASGYVTDPLANANIAMGQPYTLVEGHVSQRGDRKLLLQLAMSGTDDVTAASTSNARLSGVYYQT